jgi:hypothetical protein
MKDLLNTNVELNKTEIQKAYALNANSKKVCTEVSNATSKANSLRTTVIDILSKLAVDGRSQSNLNDLELSMNNLKVQKKIDQMKTLKATIEYAYKVLVADDTKPYFCKENRKSMKSVDINTLTPCVMTEVLAPKVKAKEGVLVTSTAGDMIVNLTADADNKFESKNKVLFSLMTEIDNDDFVVSDEEFNYTFETVISELRKEILKARLTASEESLIEEVEIIEAEEV